MVQGFGMIKGVNMALYTVTNEIISLFLVVLIGFYAGKKDIINESITNGLSKFLLDISLPLMIIVSFHISYSPTIVNNLIKAFIYGLIIFIVTPLFVKSLIIKVEKRKRNILQFAMVFSNCGFMGFPLVQSVFGSEGVIYASIFNMVFNIFVWTYGVMLFNETTNIKEIIKTLKNPGIIAAVIGLLIMIFSINIPAVLLNTMKMVGDLTTPVSMLIIGSILSRTEFKNALKDASMYYGSFIKLVLLPLTLLLVSLLLKQQSIVINTFILMQAMPAATTTLLFAESFNKEKEYSALVVSFSTLLSIITIPLLIKFCL